MLEFCPRPATDGIVVMGDVTKHVNGMRLGGVTMLRPGLPAEFVARLRPGGEPVGDAVAGQQLCRAGAVAVTGISLATMPPRV